VHRPCTCRRTPTAWASLPLQRAPRPATPPLPMKSSGVCERPSRRCGPSCRRTRGDRLESKCRVDDVAFKI